MAIVPLFKHRKPFINVTGASLTKYQFTQHRYFTAEPAKIAELQKLVESRACGIYIDPKEPTIDTEASDPASMLKKSVREQVLAELRASGKLVEDSDSKQTGLGANVVNTASSTITNNSAAERVEAQRQEQVAEAQAAAATDPALSALEKLKASQNQQPK